MLIIQKVRDWVLGTASAGYKRKEAGICWDAWLLSSSLSLQNLCLEEEAALLEVFYELHGH